MAPSWLQLIAYLSLVIPESQGGTLACLRILPTVNKALDGFKPWRSKLSDQSVLSLHPFPPLPLLRLGTTAQWWSHSSVMECSPRIHKHGLHLQLHKESKESTILWNVSQKRASEVGKDARCQVWWPVFNPQDPQDRTQSQKFSGLHKHTLISKVCTRMCATLPQ